VGERRRPLAALLALVLPAGAGGVPDVLGDVALESFHRAVNRVRPSLSVSTPTRSPTGCTSSCASNSSRSSSPERSPPPTSRKHGTPVSAEYLGLEVRSLRWACCRTSTVGGAFGYFPTYQLGNVMSVQIWEAARAAAARPGRTVRAGRLLRF